MGAPVIDISITKGKTFEFAYRYADEALVYKAISAMPNATPVRLTVVGHGIPDGWPLRIEGVKQPCELNSEPDDCAGFQIATVIDSNTIELNRLSADGWRAYTSGGFVVFNAPYDLTGHSARMQVRDRVGGTVLLTLDSDSAADRDGTIALDTDLASIVAKLDPTVTAGIDWKTGVYDLELKTASGDIYPVTAVSAVRITPEVTQ